MMSFTFYMAVNCEIFRKLFAHKISFKLIGKYEANRDLFDQKPIEQTILTNFSVYRQALNEELHFLI